MSSSETSSSSPAGRDRYHRMRGTGSPAADAVRDQARRRAHERAASARSAVVERARLRRDATGIEELKSLVRAHWSDFEASFTPDERDALDADQLAALEAEFVRECEDAASGAVAALTLTPPADDPAGWMPSSSQSFAIPSSPMMHAMALQCVVCGAPGQMQFQGNALRCRQCAVCIWTQVPYEAVVHTIEQTEWNHSQIGCPAPHLSRGYHPDEGLVLHCPECQFVEVVL
ncbi:hypothetical protein H9P43_005119 [Blastocladiella emersonii ATCC 22665]|nr:hypothetical protein H9P43_005119 [Blastocladiella emersonii ATCC 22665]